MDDEYREDGPPAGTDSTPPLQAVCFFDSTLELRGFIEESWLELQAAFDDAQSPLGSLAFTPDHIGARIGIDAALEITLCLYPIIDGVHREDLGEAGATQLLQLHDDGYGGVDPGQLQVLLDWLLEDILPGIGHYDASVLEERFAGGKRALVLCATSGRWLDLPPSMTGDY